MGTIALKFSDANSTEKAKENGVVVPPKQFDAGFRRIGDSKPPPLKQPMGGCMRLIFNLRLLFNLGNGQPNIPRGEYQKNNTITLASRERVDRKLNQSRRPDREASD
ncbi:hypothetical protein LguiB_000691 [Lonicera macranthoides]